jgi:Ca2+-binding RTX toxin-like protein
MTVADKTILAARAFAPDLAGGPAADEAVRIDAPSPIVVDGDEDQELLGVTSLYDGGFVVHWVVDSDHDGEPDGFAIQRYGADGAKQGGIVTLQGVSSAFTHPEHMESFDLVALDDGGYALSYALGLDQYHTASTLTASAANQTLSAPIVGRPLQIGVQTFDPQGVTYALFGTGNNGQPITIPVTPVNGVISVTQAILDQLGVDDRMTLLISGVPQNQSVTLSTDVVQDVTYDPASAVHSVARSVTTSSSGTSVGAALSVSSGRAEGFHVNAPSFVDGVPHNYIMMVTPIEGPYSLDISGIPGAVIAPNGTIQFSVAPDANGNVAVPPSILSQLDHRDIAISLVVTGLVPGSTLSGTVSVRDAIPQPEGVFVQTFNAQGVATSAGDVRIDSGSLPVAGDDGAVGVTAIDGGGLVVRWVVDTDRNGDADGLAVQRFDAAGNKVGGVVALSGISDALVHSSNIEGFDLVALDNGHYALSYALGLESYSHYVPLTGSGTGTTQLAVPIVGRPSDIFVSGNIGGATFSLIGTGPNGTVTIPVTLIDSHIQITQAMLDQLTIDDRMTLRVTGLAAGQSATVIVNSFEDITYANSPLHDVARSFTLPGTGTSISASFGLQTGRPEKYHLDTVTFAQGAAQNPFLLVNPVQGAGFINISSIPGAVLLQNGQIQIPVTLDGGNNIIVPPALLAALGDHDATITLILTGLQPGSTLSGTISTRDGTPLPEGVFVQLFGADGAALGQPGAPIDAGGVSDGANVLGITPLDGGGFVVRWVTDAPGDGETGGISVQRYDAAGNKVSGIVAIDVASALHLHGGEVEQFAFAALADGSYTLTYDHQPESTAYELTVTGTGAGQPVPVPISGRPDYILVDDSGGKTYSLSGLGNNGQPVTVLLTVANGKITITQAVLDQFGVDDRLVLLVNGLAAGATTGVLVHKVADVFYDPAAATHDVARNAAVSALTAGQFAGTGLGVLGVPSGRAEAFYVNDAVHAGDKALAYQLYITPATGRFLDLSNIPDAIRLQNGEIIIPVTPNSDGKVAVPQSILDQLGDSDAGIQLLVYGLQPGTGFTGMVSVRDAMFAQEGVYVHTFDAAGHPTGGDLTIMGDANANELHGAAGDDMIGGGGGNDLIDGGAGNDTIDGGTGADQMIGGLGNDIFKADRQDDVVFENAGEGTDTVIASASYYLYANIENLTLAAGAGDIFGVGNDLANTITGNEGANLLLGGGGDDVGHGNAGNDVLYGQDGNDVLFGDAGIDYLIGGDGNDVLRGGNDEDGIYGEAGNDILWGGADFKTDIFVGGDGNDVLHGDSGQGDYDLMDGGAGDDSYYVDTGADLTFEAVGGGTDTVYANVGAGQGVYLYANVENLVLLGQSFFGVGNELDNHLTGNAEVNWLLGGAGNDTIDGKGGNDVLYGEAGADTFVFTNGSGADYIGDFTPGSDRIDLSAYGFTSFAQVQSAMTENAGTTAINFGNGNYVILNGVGNAALHQGDFVYATGQAAQAPEPRIADDDHLSRAGLLHLLDTPHTLFVADF